MKKYLLIFATAFMLCSTATMAQKVDLDGLSSKIEKCDADVENPKKSTKAATWVARGDAYVASIVKPTESLFIGVDPSMMEITNGKANSTATATVGTTEYKTYVYPYFTAYALDNAIVAWKINEGKIVCENALELALASYAKAVEIDPSISSKIKPSLDALSNYYKVMGNIAVELSDMVGGAEAFVTVSDISELPYNGGKVDASVLFYAGYMLTIDGNDNPESYVMGEAYLKKALDNGYNEIEDANEQTDASSRGNIYYYIFTCAYGQREADASKLAQSKEYLLEGVEKYPANERIFEGLMQLYTNEEGMGDPAELLGTVEKLLAANPQDQNAWFSRGRIYYALKQYDESIESFKHVVEIAPSLYEGHFYLGLFYMLKADDMLEAINSTTYTDQSKYNADLEALNNAYADCVAPFEAAYELKPDDRSALEYLKQLCFRLRDMPGMMDKYTKYNDLLSAM